MAAVSTNYGTAGDSNLKSGYGSSSQTPKENSSGSGSGSKSRSAASGSASAPRSRTGLLAGEERRTWRSLLWERRAGKSGSGRTGDCEKGCLVAGGIGAEGGTAAAASQPIELEELDRKGLTSAGSDGSTKMIIRKDVQYSVEYKRKISDASTNPDAQYWDTYVTSEP